MQKKFKCNRYQPARFSLFLSCLPILFLFLFYSLFVYRWFLIFFCDISENYWTKQPSYAWLSFTKFSNLKFRTKTWRSCQSFVIVLNLNLNDSFFFIKRNSWIKWMVSSIEILEIWTKIIKLIWNSRKNNV